MDGRQSSDAGDALANPIRAREKDRDTPGPNLHSDDRILKMWLLGLGSNKENKVYRTPSCVYRWASVRKALIHAFTYTGGDRLAIRNLRGSHGWAKRMFAVLLLQPMVETPRRPPHNTKDLKLVTEQFRILV